MRSPRTLRPSPARIAARQRYGNRDATAGSVLPVLEGHAASLREDVGLERLQPEIVLGQRLSPHRILDAPVDHVAEQRDPTELDLELRVGLRMRVGRVRMAHVTGDADRAAEQVRAVEDARSEE